MWSIASCTTTSNQVTSKQPAHLYKYYNWSAHLLLSKKKLSPNFPPICARSQIAILSVLLWLPMLARFCKQNLPLLVLPLRYPQQIQTQIWNINTNTNTNKNTNTTYTDWWGRLLQTDIPVLFLGYLQQIQTLRHQGSNTCVMLRSNKFKSNGFFSGITLQAGPLPRKSQTYNIYHLANLANKSE